MEYVNFHCHDHYSTMDAIATCEDYAKVIKKGGGEFLVITNHGTVSGAWEQHRVCKEYGLHPIYGCEMYIVDDISVRERGYYHIVLLVKNKVGWKNLLKLTSLSHTMGFYYKPRIDWQMLEKYSEGLVALSGCLSGVVSRCILNGEKKLAIKWAKYLKEIFGVDFYLEMLTNKMKEQRKVNFGLCGISKECDIPLIITVDSHYIKKRDADVHDMALAISRGEYFYDESRSHYSTNDFWFHNEAQAYKIFRKNNPKITPDLWINAFNNVGHILNRCKFDFEEGGKYLPKFDPSKACGYGVMESCEIIDNINYLKSSCLMGLESKFGNVVPPIKYQDRVDMEIKVIEDTGYVDYMLIVADIINWAKSKGIQVGAARGSAAGSVVAWVLGITEIDSIRHGLSFERFMNKVRMSVEMPDIDVDIQRDRRWEVINYIKDKYGKNNVCSIIGHSKLAAKGALKSVATCLRIPFVEANNITKMFGMGESFEEAYGRDEKLTEVKNKKGYEDWFRYSEALEGRIRYSTKHAAGIVITPGRSNKFIPLCIDKEGNPMSQWDKKDLEFAGMLKIDLLGLSTLETINNALKLIKDDIDIDSLNLEDKKILKEFNRANTDSVFQFETDNMKNLLKGTPIKSFEMLPALNALGRPGTLKMGMHYKFMERAKGDKKVVYLHPILESILKDTFGIIVYQEQVQQIAGDVGGLTPEDADRLRVAMKLKKPKEMKSFEEKFIRGAIKKKVPNDKAKKIWELINAFAAYTFNKSHAVAYSYISWQCMYLKTYYPLEWFIALFNTERGDQEKIAQYRNYMESNYDIKLHKPDIVCSEKLFIKHKDGILYGLASIKDIGDKSADKIVALKLYVHEEELIEKLLKINKRVVEALFKSGALGVDERASKFLDLYKKARKDEIAWNMPVDHSEKLINEKYYFGFFFSEPFKPFKDKIKKLHSLSVWKKKAQFSSSIQGYAFVVKRKEYKTKNDEMMAFVTLSDGNYTVETLCWPSDYIRFRRLLAVGSMIQCSIRKLKKRSVNEEQKYLIVGVKSLLI